MSYKRTVKKGEKSYGPYIYESYRDENGVVRKRYLGKVEEKKTRKPLISLLFTFSILLLVFASLSFENPIHNFVEQQTGLTIKTLFTGFTIDESVSEPEGSIISSEEGSMDKEPSGDLNEISSEETTDDAPETTEDKSSSSEDGSLDESSGVVSEETKSLSTNDSMVWDSVTDDEVIEDKEIAEEDIHEEDVITPINESVNETESVNESQEENESSNESVEIIFNETINETIEINETINESIEESVNETESINESLNETLEEIPIENVTLELNESLNLIDSKGVQVVQYEAVVNRPVKWIVFANESDFKDKSEVYLDLPKNAEDINILIGREVDSVLEEKEKYKKLVDEASSEKIVSGLLTGNVVLDLDSEKGAFERFIERISSFFRTTGNVISEIELESEEKIFREESRTKVDLTSYKDLKEKVAVTYYTPAPVSKEETPGKEKVIVVSAEEDLGYENVKAYTEIDDSLKVNDKANIRLLWYEDIDLISEICEGCSGKVVDDFSAEDRNNDGFIDYIEWNVPHLSNQSYKVLIEIREAYWLDENRTVLEDVYDKVNQSDGIYQVIPEGDYLRVIYEVPLTNEGDTVLKANASEDTTVEMYEKDSDVLLLTFTNITNYTKNRMLLDMLPEGYSQDTFDLLSVGGDVSYDLVYDADDCTSTSDCEPDYNCIYTPMEEYMCQRDICTGNDPYTYFHCPSDEDCVSGECVLPGPTSCTSNSGCASNEFCNSSGYCQSDLSAGSSCDFSVTYSDSSTQSNGVCSSGYCRDDYSDSNNDGNCDSGESCYCASSSTTCVHNGVGTISSGSYASGVCYDTLSRWKCTSGIWGSSACSPAGYICSSGTCSACSSTSQCPSGYNCLRDVAEESYLCKTDNCQADYPNYFGCQSGEVCFPSGNGDCYVACSQNSDCASNQFCNSSQMCQSTLSSGSACDFSVTYGSSTSESDGACISDCIDDYTDGNNDGNCDSGETCYCGQRGQDCYYSSGSTYWQNYLSTSYSFCPTSFSRLYCNSSSIWSSVSCPSGQRCVSGSCTSSCTLNSQCPSGYFCSSSGSCTAELSSGSSCNHSVTYQNGEIYSNQACSSDVCMDTFNGNNDGTCESGEECYCAESTSHCVYDFSSVSAGTYASGYCASSSSLWKCTTSYSTPWTTESCSAGYYCSSGNCVNTCTANSQCPSGYYCNSGGTCAVKLSTGSACDHSVTYNNGASESNGACSSGYCRDDFAVHGSSVDGSCGSGESCYCASTSTSCIYSGSNINNGSYVSGVCGNDYSRLICDNVFFSNSSCSAGYYCSSGTCSNTCTENANCLEGYFCSANPGGGSSTCSAQLSDGTNCFEVSYLGQITANVTEDDGACSSGYCDNDGVGQTRSGYSDDYWCFTPTKPSGESSYRYDNQDSEWTCEYSADSSIPIFADEMMRYETYSNKGSSSHYFGCPAYSSCVIGDSCVVHDGDEGSSACSLTGGNWTSVGGTGKVDSADANTPNCSLGVQCGTAGGYYCCGDDAGENYLSKIFHSSLSGDTNHYACCDSSTSCVISNGTCVASGGMGDADGDDTNDYCNSGTWQDCTIKDASADFCNTTAGYYCNSSNYCTNVCLVNEDCHGDSFLCFGGLCTPGKEPGEVCTGQGDSICKGDGGCKKDYASDVYYCANLSTDCVHNGEVYSEGEFAIHCADNGSSSDDAIRKVCYNGAWDDDGIHYDSQCADSQYCVDGTSKSSPATCTDCTTTECSDYQSCRDGANNVCCDFISTSETMCSTSNYCIEQKCVNYECTANDAVYCGRFEECISQSCVSSVVLTALGDFIMEGSGYYCGTDLRNHTHAVETNDINSYCSSGNYLYFSEGIPPPNADMSYQLDCGNTTGFQDGDVIYHGHFKNGVVSESYTLCGLSFSRSSSNTMETIGTEHRHALFGTFNADESSLCCTSCRGSGYWNIGGEVSATTCCGDDPGEYKRTRVVGATMDNGYSSNSSDDACCSLNNKCVDEGECYSSGYSSSDVDSDGDNDYCLSGTWVDCNSDSQCATGYVCSSNDCVLGVPVIDSVIPKTGDSLNSRNGRMNISLSGDLPSGYVYKVQKKIYGGSFSDFGTTEFSSMLDTSLNDNSEYCYRVQFWDIPDGFNPSSWSSEVCNITLDRTGPAAPSIDLTNNPSSGIDLRISEGDDGLILYMPFEEGSGSTTYDWSSQGNDGTITGATFTTGKSGNGGAMSFGGVSSDYILTDESLGLSGDPNLTISLWAKWDGASWSTNWPAALCINTRSSYSGLSVTFNNGKPALDFWNYRYQADEALNVNQWYYITVTKTSGGISSTSKIYVNGVEVDGTGNSASSPNIVDSQLYIGRLDSTRNFNGSIDEVRIYNRSLTQREIIDDMQSGLIKKNLSRSDSLTGSYSTIESDLASNLYSDTGVVDSAAPNMVTGLSSTSHSTSTWSNNANVQFSWTSATDEGTPYYYYANAFDSEGNSGAINLLALYNIDWTDPSSWSSSSGISWDETEQALKVVDYRNVHLDKTKIPINTSKKYYLEYDIKQVYGTQRGSYSGTHSYATEDGSWLPGHPGSYDSFVDSNSMFTNNTWVHRRNNAISGEPRTGESSTTSERDKWHTGTNYATIMFLFNYAGSGQTTYIKNLKFYEYDELKQDYLAKDYFGASINYTSGVDGYSFHPSCAETKSKDFGVTSGTYAFTNNGTSNYLYMKTKDNAGLWSSGCTSSGPYWICTGAPLVDSNNNDPAGTVSLTDSGNTCGCSSSDNTSSCDTAFTGTKTGICCGSSCVGSINSECCINSDCGSGYICNASYICEDVDPPTVGQPTLYTGTRTGDSSGSYFKGTVGIQSQVSDSGSGLNTSSCEVNINGDGWTFLGVSYVTGYCRSGIYSSAQSISSIQFRINDAAGNTGTSSSSSFTYDGTAPTTTATGTAPPGGAAYTYNTWTKESVGTTLSCNDGAGSGCASTKYCTDTSNSCTPTTTYSSRVDVSSEGTNYIRYSSTDNLGTAETTKSSTIKVDKTAPTTSGAITSGTAGSNGWYISNVGYTITPADALSGVASTVYCTDTTNTCTPSTTYSSALTLSTEGNNYVRFRSTDNAGNVQTIQSSGLIKIDKTSPSCSLSSISESSSYAHVSGSTVFYNTASTGSFAVTTTASDSTSGIQKVNFPTTVSAGADDTSSPYSQSYSWDGSDTYSQAATVTCYDNAGLTNTHSFTVTKDTTAPTGGNIKYTDGYYTTASVSITYATGTDSQAGLNTTSGKIQRQSATLSTGSCGTFGSWGDLITEYDGSHVDSTVTSGNCYKYRYVISDNVLNTATYTNTSVVKVDTSAPATPTINYFDGYIKVTNNTVTFSSTDAQSGISSYTLYRRSATLSSGSCGTFGSWSSLGTKTSPYSDTVTNGNCYQYYVTVTNNAGLTASSTTSPTATTKVDTTNPSISYTSPTPADSSRQTANSVTISATVSDAGSGLDKCVLEWSGVNQTVNPSGGICSATKSTTDGTTYTFKMYVNDSAGNWNSEAQRSFRENAKPSITSAVITPSSPTTIQDLTCTVSGWSDADSDSANYYFEWYKNSVKQFTNYKTGTTDVVNSGNLTSGDTWNCTVIPYDGYENGTAKSDSVVIEQACYIDRAATLSENLDCSGQSLIITSSGELNAGSYNVKADNATIDGTLTSTSGFFNITDGTTTVSGTGSVTAGTGDDYLAGLTIASGGSYSATSGTTTVNGQFDNNAGSSGFVHNGGGFNMCGDISGIFFPGGAVFNNYTILDCTNRVNIYENMTVLNSFKNYEGGHPPRLVSGMTLTMGNSSHSGTIGGTAGLYLYGSSTIRGYNQDRLAIITQDPLTYEGTRYFKWVDLQGDLSIANVAGSFTFEEVVKAQNIAVGAAASLIFENDSEVLIDSLSVSGTFVAGNGSITKNNNAYFEIDLDDAASYSFGGTTISYGNNTGSEVIDARNAVDGGNNVPAGMWKFGEISVDFIEPEDNYISGTSVFFKCNASGDANLVNMTLYHNSSGSWSSKTNDVSGTSTSSIFNISGAIGNFNWYCGACDDYECAYTVSNRTIIVDTTNPLVSFVSPTPANNDIVSVDSVVVNVSSSDNSGNHSTFVDWNNSLIGWWRMDDVSGSTVIDYTGNNNGTIIGDVHQMAGVRGDAMSFDGAGDYISIPSLNPTEAVTVSGWFRKEGSPGLTHHILYMQGTQVEISIPDSTGKIRAGVTTTTSRQVFDDGSGITDGDWHHLSMTYNGSKLLSYIDGVQVGSHDITGGDITTGSSTNIGYYSGGYYANGSIDDVMVFNRALSADEIKSIYDAQANQYYNNFTGLESEGEYSFKAYAQDMAGNVNETEERSTTINLEVNDCGDITEAGTYYLANDVSSTGTCFNILADNITLDCQGHAINFSSTSTGFGIKNQGYDFVEIKNCTIQLTNEALTNSRGINLYDSPINNSIVNSNIYIPTDGSGARYNYGIILTGAQNTTVENNTVEIDISGWNGYYNHGIYLDTGSSNIVKSNNITVSGYGGYGINLASTSNNLIEGNNIETIADMCYGVYLESSSSNEFYNNSIITREDDGGGNTAHGVHLESGNSNIFRNNDVVSIKAPSYVIRSATGTDIDSSNTAEGFPVWFNNSLNNHNFNGNDFSSYGQVICSGCSNVNYTDVTVKNDGLLLIDSANCSILNSYIEGNYSHGLFLYNGDDNYINNTNITALASSVNPLKIRIGSDRNLFENNNIYSTNGEFSAYIQSSNYNTFFNNDFSATSYGIFFYGGVNYHNFTKNNVSGSVGFFLDSQSSTNSTFEENIIVGTAGNAIYAQRGNNNYIFKDNDFSGGKVHFSSNSNHTVNMTNTINYGTPSFSSGSSGRIYIYSYLDVKVNDTQGNIQNANVTAWNVDNTLQFSELTNSTGQIGQKTLYVFYKNDTYSKDYSNFTVNVTDTSYAPETRSIDLSESQSIVITFTVGDPSLYKFELEDSTGAKSVYIDDKGDMYLKGNLFTGQTISSVPANSFVIQNSGGSNVGYFTDGGSLYLAGNVEISSGLTGTGNKLEFRNSTDHLVAFIDESGNLKLQGGYVTGYTNF